MKERHYLYVALVTLVANLLFRVILFSYWMVFDAFTMTALVFFNNLSVLVFWWCLVRVFGRLLWFRVGAIVVILLHPLQGLLYGVPSGRCMETYVQPFLWFELAGYISVIVRNDRWGFALGVVLLAVGAVLEVYLPLASQG